MAKYTKLKASVDVTGKTAQEIANMGYSEVRKLGEKDLARYVSRLVSATNKRIRRFQQAEMTSPALTKLGSDLQFSVKFGKDVTSQERRGKLLNLYKRLSTFYNYKTSTIKGLQTFRKEQKELVENAIGRKVSKGEMDKAFRILHKAQETEGFVDAKRGSEGSLQAREIVFDILNEDINLDDDEVLNRLNNEYHEWTREKETSETEM